MLRRRYSAHFIIAALVLFGGMFFVQEAQAATGTLRVVVRDENGDLLRNQIRYKTSKQQLDADGNPVPGIIKKTGLIEDTGFVDISYTSGENYAVELYHRSEDATFYYYNQFVVDGAITTLDVRLSSLHFISRDGDGALLPDIAFDIYTQNYDADGNPLRNVRVARNLSTNDEGELLTYLPSGTYALTLFGTASGYDYTLFNQVVAAEERLVQDYEMSTARFVFTDAAGTLQHNTQFNLYTQGTDASGNPFHDATVVSKGTTGDSGEYVAQVPPATYSLQVYSSAKGYYYDIWNVTLTDLQTTRVRYALSALDISTELVKGTVLTDHTVKVYKQATDIDGNAVKGGLAISGKTGNTGHLPLFLPPDTYYVEVSGSASDYSYHIPDQAVREGQTLALPYRLSHIKFTYFDSNGAGKKAYKYKVATQKLNANGLPIVDTVIFTGDTGEQGYGIIFLPPGTYALLSDDEKEVRLWDLKVLQHNVNRVDFPRGIVFNAFAEMGVVTPLSNSAIQLTRFHSDFLPRIDTSLYKEAFSHGYKFSIKTYRNPVFLLMKIEGSILADKGLKASDIVLGYYNPGTKKWHTIGGLNPVHNIIIAGITAKEGTIALMVKR